MAPDGKAYLIDAGDDSQALLCHLERLEVGEVEGVFISHAHRDHYGALPELAKAVPIRKLYLPLTGDSDSAWLQNLNSLELRVLPRKNLVRGDFLDLGSDAKLTALWPTPSAPLVEPALGENDLSTVLRFETGESCVLFTGDIESESERRLLQLSPDLNCDILKIAHHGSRTSSGLPFLASVSPAWAVISSDSSVYGHPHAETLEALRRFLPDTNRIHRTDRQGSIAFEMGREGITKVEIADACPVR